MATSEITCVECKWEDISTLVGEHVIRNDIIVESFWESHVLESKHYMFMASGEAAGFFAIHKKTTMTLFSVLAPYANHSQELFARARKFEEVTNAMVPTGDEMFVSLCLDNFARMEKQAYFAIYTDKEVPAERYKDIELRMADVNKDSGTLSLCGDFLDEEIKKKREGHGAEHLEIYIAEYKGDVVGFGVVEYGRVIKDIASIGMYVREPYRQQGIAASILQNLKNACNSKGFRVFSGCWYYNHNSKKSMESAGAYSKTRLLRFYF